MGYRDSTSYDGETIIAKNGKLFLERAITPPDIPVRVVVGQFIHVGCHRITKEAWALLKKGVDNE